jgi:hypothetical protein
VSGQPRRLSLFSNKEGKRKIIEEEEEEKKKRKRKLRILWKLVSSFSLGLVPNFELEGANCPEELPRACGWRT